jgi:protein ImuA
MSPPNEILAGLRQALRALEHPAGAPGVAPFTTGAPELDDALGGGLARGVLHEIHAEASADAASATGFAALLALRAAECKPIAWIRQDYADVEAGALHAPGLAELGIDPDRLILVRARNAADVLRASAEAVRCPALGAVLMEPWGEPKALDLTASRRLSLAAADSGVTLLLIRTAAQPSPSAATTRWSVRARLSAALEANAPGLPAFTLALLRHRAGVPAQRWDLEWDRDRLSFRTPPLPRPVPALPPVRTPATAPGEFRRAG